MNYSFPKYVQGGEESNSQLVMIVHNALKFSQICSREKRTALHLACENSIECTRALLSYQSSKDIIDLGKYIEFLEAYRFIRLKWLTNTDEFWSYFGLTMYLKDFVFLFVSIGIQTWNLVSLHKTCC